MTALQPKLEEIRALAKSGQPDQAEALCRSLLADDPDCAEALQILGVLQIRTGDLDAAEGSFRRVIALRPDSLSAYKNLIKLIRLKKDNEEVVALLRAVLAHHPENIDLCFDLGCTLFTLRRLEEAQAMQETTLRLSPDHLGACYQLGLVLRERGRLPLAEKIFERALSIDPQHAETLNVLAVISRDQGRLEEAKQHYKKAIAIQPDNAGFHNNLGLLYRDQGRTMKALECYQEAIRLKPVYPEAHNNLGATLNGLGRLGEASAACRRALEQNPNFANAWNNLASTLRDQGQIKDAFRAYHQAIKCDPRLTLARSNLQLSMHYDERSDPKDILAQSRQWEGALKRIGEQAGEPFQNDPNPTRKLRVGYVSPDFRQHVVSYFFRPLIELHDRNEVEVHCYAEVYKPDQITKWIRERSDGWVWTPGLAADELAEKIRHDQIDILVDLAGHTAKNRLDVFTLRPAPLLLTWLGYPGTTGLSAMDYRITDQVADPKGETEAFHSEKLLRLPGFLCYRPPTTTPEVSALPFDEAGIITFGSFNNLSKVTPTAIEAWAAILKRVPGSRMIIKAKSLGDAETRKRLTALFAEHGIEQERVDLLAWVDSRDGHLGAYSLLDIGLDTFPYNGTTTTCEALWMGVPVVTYCGGHHANRVGASLLTRAGLEPLIALDLEQFIDCAVSLAQDLTNLRDLRAGLRAQVAASPLCDAPAFARSMEQAYREIWRRWCARGDART